MAEHFRETGVRVMLDLGSRRVIVIFATTLVAGCATSGQAPTSSSPPPVAAPRTADAIGRQEARTACGERTDVWITYRDGRKATQDQDCDGRPDVRFVYEGGDRGAERGDPVAFTYPRLDIDPPGTHSLESHAVENRSHNGVSSCDDATALPVRADSALGLHAPEHKADDKQDAEGCHDEVRPRSARPLANAAVREQ
jgi:hypothetical protein